MATPVSGPVAVLKFGTTTAPAMDWKLSIDAKLKDTSNFADGRQQTETLNDADFSCKVVYDSTSLPSDPAGLNLSVGTLVTAKAYVTSTQFYSVPIKVSKVDVESEVEGVVMYNVSGKLSGVITDPIIA